MFVVAFFFFNYKWLKSAIYILNFEATKEVSFYSLENRKDARVNKEGSTLHKLFEVISIITLTVSQKQLILKEKSSSINLANNYVSIDFKNLTLGIKKKKK